MKFLLLFCTCFTFSMFLNAQKFSVEPHISINIMPLPKTDVGTEHKIAFAGGLTGRYEIAENLTIDLGLGLSSRRQQYRYSDTLSVLDQYRFLLELAGVDVDEIDSTLQSNGLYLNQFNQTNGVVNLLHLEIPISVSYQWKSLSLSAGGYVGFKINSSKKEELISDVPLLQTVDLNQIDTSGTISMFFPPAHSVTYGTSNSDDNLDQFIYGMRLKLAYVADNHLSFYASYNLDLNNYAIEHLNEVTNNKYFIRLGMAYNIFSLKMNTRDSKPKFE